MIKSSPLILLASVLLLLTGCSNEETVNTGTTDDAISQVAPTAPAVASQQIADFSGNRGRVLSTIDVPGYSYIEVETNGRSLWIAGNPVKVTEGEIIGWDGSTVMKNFHSKTLGRTFAEVIFVNRIHTASSQAAGAMPAARPPITAPRRQTTTQGQVVSVQNAANYSYLQIKTADDNLLWLAAPETPVNVDDTVSWQGGSLMRDFTSSTLGRTFPEIYFVTAVQVKN